MSTRGIVGGEGVRGEGERRRKIAGAPSGRPPTEGNELAGPRDLHSCPLESETASLSLFLPIRIACVTLKNEFPFVYYNARAALRDGLSLSLGLSLTGQNAPQEILAVLRAAAVARRVLLVILLGLARGEEYVGGRGLLLLRRGAARLDLLHSHRLVARAHPRVALRAPSALLPTHPPGRKQ